MKLCHNIWFCCFKKQNNENQTTTTKLTAASILNRSTTNTNMGIDSCSSSNVHDLSQDKLSGARHFLDRAKKGFGGKYSTSQVSVLTRLLFNC